MWDDPHIDIRSDIADIKTGVRPVAGLLLLQNFRNFHPVNMLHGRNLDIG